MSSLTPSAIELLSSADQELVAELVEECMIALENGIPIEVETLVGQHPRLEEPLRRCLASLQTLHEAVHGMNDTIPNHPSFEMGGRLGDFQLEEVIGRGGMGVVYLATQLSLDRKVALKILPGNRFASPKRLKRFLLEAQSAAQLQHPHIVPVFAVGEDSHVYYYAMQWIDGVSLDQIDATNWTRNRFEKLTEAGFEIAMALQHAHDCGIVHRDIKPSNLMLDKQGKVWIADFGLALRSQESSLTHSGELVGTANYMSPEQSSGSPVDERTDIYSLGATLYELATGHQAFNGNGLQDVLRKIERDEPIRPRKLAPSLPVDLETIICKAMSKDREDRYRTAAELAMDLAAFREHRPIHGRRPGYSKILSKWLVRHMLLVGVGMAGIGLCLAIMLIGLVQVWHERNATNAALRQSQVNLKTAQSNYWRGRNLLDRWNEKLLPQLATIPEASSIRSAMLADTIEYYEEYLDKAADDPALVVDRDLSRLRLAEAYVQSGNSNQAIANFDAAIKDLTVRDASLEPAQKRALYVAHNDLSLVHLACGNVNSAKALLIQSLQGHDQLVSEHPEVTEFLANKAAAHLNLAQAYHALSDSKHEADQREIAENLYRDLAGTNEAPLDYRSELGVLLDHRAVSLAKSKTTEALRVAQEAAQWHRSCVADARSKTREWQRLGASLHNLGVLYAQADNGIGSRDCLNESIAIRKKLADLEPSRIQHRLELAATYSAAGSIELRFENWQVAIQLYELATITLQKWHDENREDQNGELHVELGNTLIRLGKAYMQQKERAPNSLVERIVAYRVGSMKRKVPPHQEAALTKLLCELGELQSLLESQTTSQEQVRAIDQVLAIDEVRS